MTYPDETVHSPDETEQIKLNQPPEEASEEDQSASRTWRNWIPAAVIAFGVALLGWEYREALYPLLASPLLFLVVCFGMHFFMHRGHGNH